MENLLLELNPIEIKLILKGLGELKANETFNLIQKIQSKVENHIKEIDKK